MANDYSMYPFIIPKEAESMGLMHYIRKWNSSLAIENQKENYTD